MLKSYKCRLEYISGIIVLSIIPAIATLLISIPFIVLMGKGNTGFELIQTLLSMSCGFVIIPSIIAKSVFGFSFKRLEKDVFCSVDYLICMAGVLVTYLYLYFCGHIAFDKHLLLFSAQTCIVAFCEEVWARGFLFGCLNKLLTNDILLVVLTTIIFTFVIHQNRGFMENLCYRFPGALVMTLVFYKTRKLKYAVLTHFAYNMIASI